MEIKVLVLDENGKFLDRKIKIEGGEEYILHKGMKAFLKELPIQHYGEYTIIQKKVSYYRDKSTKDLINE